MLVTVPFSYMTVVSYVTQTCGCADAGVVNTSAMVARMADVARRKHAPSERGIRPTGCE
jgi:hypothetical protein